MLRDRCLTEVLNFSVKDMRQWRLSLRRNIMLAAARTSPSHAATASFAAADGGGVNIRIWMNDHEARKGIEEPG
jgi:hypothetical protein